MPPYQFSFEAIHAHWPAYPAGHGAGYALETLGWYPRNTHFRIIDNIDQCFLLVALEFLDKNHLKNVVHPTHHHVALWHRDVRSLADDGFLDGIVATPTAVYLRDSMLAYAAGLPEELRAEVLAHIATVDWDDLASEQALRTDLNDAHLAPEGISVTQQGWSRLSSLAEPLEINQQLENRVAPLLSIDYYDSAIREAAILLESELRARTGSSCFGQQLVDAYVNKITKTYGMQGAFQLHLRAELRTLFRFIRNEFAHNIAVVPQERCLVILRRISAIWTMLDDADRGVGSFQDIVIERAGAPSKSPSADDDGFPF